jgi:hypothetical protein
MTQKQIDQLRARITNDFGEKCPEYNHWCACCTAHMAVDLLEALYLVDDLGEHTQESKT